MSTSDKWIDRECVPPQCGCIIQDNTVIAQCRAHRHARVMKHYIINLHSKVARSEGGTITFGTGPLSHQKALADLCDKLIQ